MKTGRAKPAFTLGLAAFCVALAAGGLLVYAHAGPDGSPDGGVAEHTDEHGEGGEHTGEAGCCETDQDGHDRDESAEPSHDGGEHRAEADHAGEPGDHDHDDGVAEEHSEALGFGEHEREEFGISLDTAKPGKLHTELRLPGEIEVNADRVACIVPMAPGIVRKVVKNLGDAVHSGEVMAWIESTELGAAKIEHLAKWAEVGCCTIELTRAQEVHDNTEKLLEALRSSPPLETLQEMSGAAMGDNGSALVSAYAEFVFAKAAYLREKPLYEQKISSQDDFLTAESAYKKADACYGAARDSIAFAIRRDLLEAKRAQRVREIELKGAERALYILGLSADDIKQLELLAQGQTPPARDGEVCDCGDPSCPKCARPGSGAPAAGATDFSDADERLAWHPLRAPFDGTVIEKDISLGEKVTDDSRAFTVADLSSVWVDLDIYQKDLPAVKQGQDALISGVPGVPPAAGTITYVAPVVAQQTRTALARVVLPNPDGNWRPGLFVEAHVRTGEDNVAVMVPKIAVQNLADESVVFLETDEGFESVPVALGRSNSTHVEVLSGLSPGQRYVAQGAFELKAKIVTSGLDPHAGHGH